MNTGGLTLTLHTLDDDKQGTLLTDFLYDLVPGASVFLTDTRPSVDIMTTNVATWTAQLTYSMAYDFAVPLSQEIVATQVEDATEIMYAKVMTFTAVATDTAKVNVIDPGKIIVKKETLPADSAQAFSFTIDSQVALQFSLKDGEVYTSPDLWPGVYHVTEAQVDGWLPPDGVCTDDAGKDIPPDDIDLQEGQVVTCTFVNEQMSKIIVEKVTNPTGSAQVFNFTLTDGDGVNQQFPLAHGQTHDSQLLPPGLYQVNETVPQGWQLEGAVCTDDAGAPYQAGSIDLPPGVVVTCIFTNEQLGRIIVDKVTDPADSTQSFDFTLTDGGEFSDDFSLTGGASPYDSGYLASGAYSVAETPVEGWELESALCEGVEGPQPPEDFFLAPGETINCTFNNLQLVPSLSVLKTVGEDANTCATTQELEVDAGTDVFFCFTLGNTGNVTLTEHILVDASLDVTVTFNYPLAPGDELQVTNKWLADNGKQTVLGPVTATEDFVNTVVYSSPVGEVILEDRSSAEVVLPPTGLDDDELPAREVDLSAAGGWPVAPIVAFRST